MRLRIFQFRRRLPYTLRFYAAVQGYAILVLLLVLFLPARYSRTLDLGVIVGLYVLAKLFETFDKPIFAVGHILSGHTLKHLSAGLAGYWLLRMLQKREALSEAYPPGNHGLRRL